MAAVEGGGVNYTTKELLDRIDKKIDVIDSKLDQKADRDRVHQIGNAISAMEGRILAQTTSLDNRLSLLEDRAVKRDSPVVEEIRSYQRKVDHLETQLTTQSEGREHDFSRRQKLIGSIFLGLNTILAFLALGPDRFHS